LKPPACVFIPTITIMRVMIKALILHGTTAKTSLLS
jgi:hypothetical protein